jgi:long-subunit fatty acid transport protein
LAGGISLQQAIAINDEDYSRDEDFSFAIMLQPSVSYKLNQHWAVFTRLRLQQQVIQNRLFQTNQSPYSCQVGVSYHW